MRSRLALDCLPAEGDENCEHNGDDKPDDNASPASYRMVKNKGRSDHNRDADSPRPRRHCTPRLIDSLTINAHDSPPTWSHGIPYTSSMSNHSGKLKRLRDINQLAAVMDEAKAEDAPEEPTPERPQDQWDKNFAAVAAGRIAYFLERDPLPRAGAAAGAASGAGAAA